MSYDNSFSLELENSIFQSPIMKCEKCGKTFNVGNFCPDDGGKLIVELIQKDCSYDIIKELRDFSEDADFLIDENGNINECGSGYNIEKDIRRFSKKYPDVLFVLKCFPDSGFNESEYKTYSKNGKSYISKPVLLYDDFDESKLV